jgi:hypothetical protein
MSTAVDDDLEDDAPARTPTYRDGRIIAMPAEPIPAEVNDAFLADLAFERALSAARGLAVGFSGSTEPPAEPRRAVWGLHTSAAPGHWRPSLAASRAAGDALRMSATGGLRTRAAPSRRCPPPVASPF